MKEFFPLSNGEIEGTKAPYEAAAEKLAHQLHERPDQRHNLDVFKQLLIGADSRADRLAGQRPWPARCHNDEPQPRRYTLPVFAGFSSESTVLAVLKDPWHDNTDPADWLVGEIHLPSGTYTEYLVTAVRADASNQVSLQIANPDWYGNMPPGMRPGPKQHVRDWHRVSLKLDENYLTDTAEIRFGLDGGVQAFYDIEHLADAMALEERSYMEAERPTTVHDIMAQLALRREMAEELPEAA